jgi:uncharacterized protein YndB with AHSA1/START domain
MTNGSISIPSSQAIVWRLRLSATPERVFSAWLAPEDHIKFWAERSEQDAQGFRLHFIDGTVELCQITDVVSPSHIGFRYFGSKVDIALAPRGDGTDLTLTAREVPLSEWQDVFAGWLNVLLPFKAWVDFSVDLRNHDVTRTWHHGYVDQ